MIIPRSTNYEQLLGYLSTLKERVAANKSAHQIASEKSRKLHVGLQVAVIILSALVGATLFASPAGFVKNLLALVSLLAGIIGSLQLFIRPAEAAASHKLSASLFAGLEREVEVLAASPPKGTDKLLAAIDNLSSKLIYASMHSPAVSGVPHDLILSPTR